MLSLTNDASVLMVGKRPLNDHVIFLYRAFREIAQRSGPVSDQKVPGFFG